MTLESLKKIFFSIDFIFLISYSCFGWPLTMKFHLDQSLITDQTDNIQLHTGILFFIWYVFYDVTSDLSWPKDFFNSFYPQIKRNIIFRIMFTPKHDTNVVFIHGTQQMTHFIKRWTKGGKIFFYSSNFACSKVLIHNFELDHIKDKLSWY